MANENFLGRIDGDSIIFGGMTIIDIFWKEDNSNYYERIYVQDEDSLTLKDCYNLAVKNGFTKGIITVLAERPLSGDVYRYGNYGDYWTRIGRLAGYA